VDEKRLEAHKKWVELNLLVYQKHADFLKLSAGGVVEYGKIIVQSLFALNGAGIIAVQFLFLNLDSDPLRKYSISYVWACGFFLFGFMLTLLMSLFMYKNFSAFYKNGVAEYEDEMRIIHRYVFGNKEKEPDNLKMSETEIEISYKMVHLTAWFSFILFCLGVFTLVLKISKII
jgi:hypothetical protein